MFMNQFDNIFNILWRSNTEVIQSYLSQQKAKPQLIIQQQKSTPQPLVFSGDDSISEINKWILERKRNYPTSENLAKKQEKKDKLQEYEKDLSKFEIKLRKKIKFIKAEQGESRAERLRNKNIKFLLNDVNKGQRIDNEQNTHNRVDQRERNKERENKQNIRKEARQFKKEINQIDYQSRLENKNKLEEILKQIDDNNQDDDGSPVVIRNIKKKPSHIQKQKIRSYMNISLKKKLKIAKKWVQTNKPLIQLLQQNNKNEKQLSFIIENLKQRRQEEENQLDELMGDHQFIKTGFRYKNNSLMRHLLIDEIYKERVILLQALKFIQDNNFLQ